MIVIFSPLLLKAYENPFAIDQSRWVFENITSQKRAYPIPYRFHGTGRFFLSIRWISVKQHLFQSHRLSTLVQ